MKKTLIAILLIISGNTIITAQHFISGDIVDQQTSVGVAYANVQVKGTGTGTSTDQKGRFDIEVSSDDSVVILITHIGYRSAELACKPNDSPVIIHLQPRTEILEKIIVTATRNRRGIYNVPVRTDILNEKKIDNLPSLSADDLLRSVPGILVSRGASIFGSANVSLRGMGNEAGRTLVMVDGVPVNKSDGGSVNWNAIDNEQIKQIEVVKGAGSSIHGGNAMGGVINLRTAAPQESLEGYASQGIGSFNTFDTRAGIGGRKNDIFWNFSGIYRDSDGYLSIPADETDEYSVASFLNEYQLGGRAGYYIGKDQLIEVSGSFYNGKRGTGTRFFGHGFPNNELASQEGAFNNYSNINTRVAYNGYFANNSHMNLTVHGQSENYQKIRESLRSNLITRYDVESLRDDFGFLSSWSFSPSKSHMLTTGIDLRNGSVDGADIYITSSDKVFNRGKMNLFGFYIQDEFSLSGTRWVLLTGIRYDYARFFNGAFNIEDPTKETGFLQDYEKDIEEAVFAAFSPRLSLQYHYTGLYRIYGGYSRGFRAPVLDDMSRTGLIRGGMKVGNPDLKPEHLDNVEIGGDIFIGGGITISPNIFHSRGTDYHGYISTGDSIVLNDRLRPIRIMDNIARVSVTGLELGLELQIFRGLDLSLAYSHINTEITEFRVLNQDKDNDLTGNELVYQPKDMIFTSIAWRNRYLNAFISVNHKGSQWINDVNSEKTEAFRYIDLKLWKNIYRGYSLSLKAHNLFDHEYTDSRNMIAPGRIIITEIKLTY
ncbi:MAG: TonB-dependent receptor [Cyclobacteriaceae bacterium]